MTGSRIHRRGSTCGAFGALGVATAFGVAALLPSLARADEPIAASEPRMMSETAEITSVVDAFDRDDPFDLNLTLGFQQTWKHSNIHRETALNQPGLSSGGYVAGTENVASYTRTTSKLNVGADIGIYHDFALLFRLPIILSDTQNLNDLNGSSGSPQLAQETSGLFSVPFKSPNRSGIDWFSVGLDWAIFNQQRDPGKPTWVIGAEGRFSVGTPLHACNANAPTGQVECPTPGKSASDPSTNRDPGISRGMDTIGAHTVFSRRFGYVEPYSGLWFLADFPQSNSDYGATDSAPGSVVNHPPLVGWFSMGLEVIPWEHPEQFQRLVNDFRVTGTYHSAGREYSELFDALGSSRASALTSANPGAYTAGTGKNAGGSMPDGSAQAVYFNGITDQQAYTSVGAQFSTTLQAGEYIKFQVGASLQYDQSHLITSADACNPNVTATAGTAGNCFSTSGNTKTFTGIPNPNQRPILDLPGQRFSSDDGTIIDLWVNGVVMF